MACRGIARCGAWERKIAPIHPGRPAGQEGLDSRFRHALFARPRKGRIGSISSQNATSFGGYIRRAVLIEAQGPLHQDPAAQTVIASLG